MEVRQIGNCMVTGKRENPNQGRVYDTEGVSPCISCMEGGNRQPMIIEDVKSIGNLSDAKTQSRTVYGTDGVSPTLCSGMDHGNTMPHINEKQICAIDEQNMNLRYETFGTLQTDGSSPKHNNRVMECVNTQYRIRKLTPKECWRLMGFTDEDFHKAEQVNSNTQLYKQAGNSIVTNCLVAILGQMIPGKEDVYKTRCS